MGYTRNTHNGQRGTIYDRLNTTYATHDTPHGTPMRRFDLNDTASLERLTAEPRPYEHDTRDARKHQTTMPTENVTTAPLCSLRCPRCFQL